VIVPLLERLLEDEVRVETDDDYRFLEMLLRARALPRKEGVFSPSMLASCQRQVIFHKRGVEKLKPRDPQTNGYFFKGDWVHAQWQFALWKAQEAGLLELVRVPAEAPELDFYGDGTRPAVEVRVVDGDYGGTIDAIPRVSPKGGASETFIVDFKGVVQHDFMRTVRSGAKREYRQQIVGYGNLANSVLGLGIEDCLLISECKSGPMSGSGSPLALHETRVSIAEHEGEVARRLRTLRHFETKGETPAAECVSTQHMSFQGCVFSRFCRDEVLVVQREREKAAREKARSIGAKVARPTRGG
jgi:hypothetical protein